MVPVVQSQGNNAYGEDYMLRTKELLNDYPPYGQAAVPASCLRNHLMLKEMKEGRGPDLDGHRISVG